MFRFSHLWSRLFRYLFFGHRAKLAGVRLARHLAHVTERPVQRTSLPPLENLTGGDLLRAYGRILQTRNRCRELAQQQEVFDLLPVD